MLRARQRVLLAAPLLRRHPKAKVTLKTLFKPSGGSYYGLIVTYRTIKHKR